MELSQGRVTNTAHDVCIKSRKWQLLVKLIKCMGHDVAHRARASDAQWGAPNHSIFPLATLPLGSTLSTGHRLAFLFSNNWL